MFHTSFYSQLLHRLVLVMPAEGILWKYESNVCTGQRTDPGNLNPGEFKHGKGWKAGFHLSLSCESLFG